MLRFIKKLCKFYSVTFTISIHLMLRFILSRTSVAGNVSSFQYISCYGLSKKFSGIRRKRRDFNTSHVTVYLQPGVKIDYKTGFQYISCYGLSVISVIACLYLFEFQYISCYGLSWKKKQAEIPVRIFQYISCYGLSHSAGFAVRWYRYFNTSHVTVYLAAFSYDTFCSAISIHLMLRFIAAFFSLPPVPSSFQYISCYGLSFIQMGKK
mgnify:CR=1 FL=1